MLRFFSVMVITWLVVFIIYVTAMSVGGDPSAHTEIKVERLPTDNREVTQAIADLLLVVKDTATQFGFREQEPLPPEIWGEAGETPHPIEFTDHVAGENPHICLNFSLGEFPVKLQIGEHWIDLRTSKHRKLADTLVTNLNAQGFNAAITDHTPDYRGWCWVVSLALFAVAVLLLWNRRRSTVTSGSG